MRSHSRSSGQTDLLRSQSAPFVTQIGALFSTFGEACFENFVSAPIAEDRILFDLPLRVECSAIGSGLAGEGRLRRLASSGRMGGEHQRPKQIDAVSGI